MNSASLERLDRASASYERIGETVRAADLRSILTEREKLEIALKACQDILARITGGDMRESVQHLWAEAVASETKARAVLGEVERG